MKIGRYRFGLRTIRQAPFEFIVAIVAAVPALIAGYLYAHWLLEQVQL